MIKIEDKDIRFSDMFDSLALYTKVHESCMSFDPGTNLLGIFYRTEHSDKTLKLMPVCDFRKTASLVGHFTPEAYAFKISLIRIRSQVTNDTFRSLSND